ncbi:hypothetical protein Q5P01_013591 [Channa striata]|uniref:Uncharacterized protein n=1 Tax=Channa striata TaxID=64152 RepID=A0AA88SQR1_CHASR|nr:hypothetical protein Q5P01_013591 [Channa striata]
MIRDEIKLFIILFLCQLLVTLHLKRRTGILMAAGGNGVQQESPAFAVRTLSSCRPALTQPDTLPAQQ